MTNGGGAGVMAADAAALRRRRAAALSAGAARHARRGAAADLVARQPDRHHRRRAGRALHRRRCGAARRPRRRRGAVHARADRDRAQRRHRARLRAAARARRAGRVMALLARRRRGGRGAAHLRGRRRAPTTRRPEEAVRAFAMLRDLPAQPGAADGGADAPARTAPPDIAAARAIIEAALADGREMLDELEAKAVLQAYGIPVVPTVAVGRVGRCRRRGGDASIGYPVALKILSPDITHKSDVGGVRSDLRDEAALRHAAERDAGARCARCRPAGARSTGFTVQPMVRRPHGAGTDRRREHRPGVRPGLLFGQGGTAVEVHRRPRDRAAAAEPRAGARAGVAHARSRKLLAGYRDHPPAQHRRHLRRADRACRRCSPTCPSWPSSTSIRCWADDDGVIALDARLRVAREPVRGRRRASRSGPIRPNWPRRGRGTGETIAAAADPPRGRAAAPRLRRAARRPRTCACASSARAASCRAASWRA